MANRSPNPVDKYVGSRIRMRRMMLGMSQTEVGDALGITFQQIQKYERGVNRIGAGRLQHIANFFHVTVEFFFEGGPHVGEQMPVGWAGASMPTYVSEFFTTADGLNLTNAFMRIKNSKLRRRIVNLVEAIADD